MEITWPMAGHAGWVSEWGQGVSHDVPQTRGKNMATGGSLDDDDDDDDDGDDDDDNDDDDDVHFFHLLSVHNCDISMMSISIAHVSIPNDA